MKISARFPDSNADFDILILNFRICDYLLHTCSLTVYRQELTLINVHYILCMWDTDTMYKQVIAIYMHGCKLTGQLQAYLQATPSLRRVWLARSILNYRYLHYIFACTTVSHYYREMCFKLATCADFSISDSGDYQFPDW